MSYTIKDILAASQHRYQLELKYPEINGLFYPNMSMVSGHTWLISHLKSIDALRVTRDLFDRAVIHGASNRSGPVGIFTNTLGGATFGFKTCGWRHVAPPRSLTIDNLTKIIEPYTKDGIEVPVVVIDDLAISDGGDPIDGYRHQVRNLREWALSENVILVIMATLGNAADQVREIYNDDWVWHVEGKGYYAMDRRLNSEVDGELLIDLPDWSKDVIRAVISKHRGVTLPSTRIAHGHFSTDHSKGLTE